MAFTLEHTPMQPTVQLTVFVELSLYIPLLKMTTAFPLTVGSSKTCGMFLRNQGFNIYYGTKVVEVCPRNWDLHMTQEQKKEFSGIRYTSQKSEFPSM